MIEIPYNETLEYVSVNDKYIVYLKQGDTRIDHVDNKFSILSNTDTELWVEKNPSYVDNTTDGGYHEVESGGASFTRDNDLWIADGNELEISPGVVGNVKTGLIDTMNSKYITKVNFNLRRS